jgi:hypothetical protein
MQANSGASKSHQGKDQECLSSLESGKDIPDLIFPLWKVLICMMCLVPNAQDGDGDNNAAHARRPQLRRTSSQAFSCSAKLGIPALRMRRIESHTVWVVALPRSGNLFVHEAERGRPRIRDRLSLAWQLLAEQFPTTVLEEG